MAIYSKVALPSTRDATYAKRLLIGESVSWTSIPGTNVSSRPKEGVPAGKLWLLQSIYVHNGEPETEDAEMVGGTLLLIDDSGTDHARFGNQGASGITPAYVPGSSELSWTGQLYVPAGWKVGVRLEGMAGGSGCHWRYTAIES